MRLAKRKRPWPARSIWASNMGQDGVSRLEKLRRLRGPFDSFALLSRSGQAKN